MAHAARCWAGALNKSIAFAIILRDAVAIVFRVGFGFHAVAQLAILAAPNTATHVGVVASANVRNMVKVVVVTIVVVTIVVVFGGGGGDRCCRRQIFNCASAAVGITD